METPDPSQHRPAGPRSSDGVWSALPHGHAAPHAPSRPQVSWALVLGLGALALIRPLARITGLADAMGSPTGPLVLTVLVTVAWVAIVGLGRVARPVLTLTLAGIAYGVYIIPLSAVLSALLDGMLQGPLATPFAIVPVLLTNAAWGALAGVLALAVQAARRGNR